MHEQDFLEMCRLAGGMDTGGQWTDEKIDAVEAVMSDPRGVVGRLYKMLQSAASRAEAAEASLAAVPMADIQRMQGCEAHTEDTEWAKIRVREWLAKNGRHGFWPPEDFSRR